MLPREFWVLWLVLYDYYLFSELYVQEGGNEIEHTPDG